MKKPGDREAAAKLYYGFGIRVLRALKPGTRLWQKAHAKPLTWPDPISLIKWLTKRSRLAHAGRGRRPK